MTCTLLPFQETNVRQLDLQLEKYRRFWSKVALRSPSACWPWLAQTDRDGYGRFWVSDGDKMAHRVAWWIVHGAIPKGRCVCHHCDNPGCCNPHHLFLGTSADNTADSVRKDRRAHRYGEQSSTSKLTASDVEEIRAIYELGDCSQRELAAEFGVSPAQICNITTGKQWAYLLEGGD